MRLTDEVLVGSGERQANYTGVLTQDTAVCTPSAHIMSCPESMGETVL